MNVIKTTQRCFYTYVVLHCISELAMATSAEWQRMMTVMIIYGVPATQVGTCVCGFKWLRYTYCLYSMVVGHCLKAKEEEIWRLGRKRMLRTTFWWEVIFFFFFFSLVMREGGLSFLFDFLVSILLLYFRVGMRGQRWRPSDRMSFRFFFPSCLRLAVLIFFPRYDSMHLSFALTVVFYLLVSRAAFFFLFFFEFAGHVPPNLIFCFPCFPKATEENSQTLTCITVHTCLDIRSWKKPLGYISPTGSVYYLTLYRWSNFPSPVQRQSLKKSLTHARK